MTTSFPIAPAPSASWVLALVAIPLVLVLVGAIGLMGASVVGARTARFEVDAGGIKLRGDLYGRTIPRSSIRMDGVRMVDLDGEPTLRPTRRTFGTALPGYRSGWFRLADGEKALLYVTDRSRSCTCRRRRVSPSS